MSFIHRFPVNQALWGTFINSFMWAAVGLRKDEEDAIQNMEMQKIGTIFWTVQAQNSNLKHRDHEINGLDFEVDWTSDQRRNYPLQDRRIATQYTSKVCVCSDSILCLCGNVNIVLEHEKTWENDRIREFVQGPEYQPYYDITGRPVSWCGRSSWRKRRLK